MQAAAGARWQRAGQGAGQYAVGGDDVNERGSRRRVTRCPARWIPALTCLPPMPTQPPAPTRRRPSTMAPGGSGPGGRAVAGDGRAGSPPAARSRARSVSARVTGWVLISWPSWNTCPTSLTGLWADIATQHRRTTRTVRAIPPCQLAYARVVAIFAATDANSRLAVPRCRVKSPTQGTHPHPSAIERIGLGPSASTLREAS